MNGTPAATGATMDDFRHVTVIGAGVIGASWAALFLARGLAVTVNDPLPDVAERTRDQLREAVPALKALGLPTADLDRALRFEADLGQALADADVVQENGPERLDFKQDLFARIEQAARADTLLLSSTSGIPASAMALEMKQPGRLVIGHPFNPPHLVPLVEVVPGEQTDPDTVRRAVAFYTALGKKPQVLRRQVPGFVANRLQAAFFREAVDLVVQGVVTEQELDDIVTSSLGLRWAVAGPFRSFHLGDGPGGLPDFLQHLGPALEDLWRDLGTPALDEATVELLSGQADFGATVEELEGARDEAQIRVMRALGDG
ncbi:3-hydroxyacyl-CoA dehydrogenase NAD-binding domain-containing protein [Streptomyces sp. LS1784]|uniref:3-hydroxyacyl-CoA dehydrogenase NAD-binding domain-containing protein n=1 Tax=Streptomyces sp. LS1784 TaxID=2851533 RepID=UPI001CCE2949|nr:3-hydroxyacyl-CoA dehydrogenase NAD-binding domain-containing protein [Streptomyces sp. LS1784]